MGVPAFFRWLSRKYPSIVVHANEEKARQLEDGTTVPVDATQPNPNDVEFDNLYLDMNGIIHPCCHPENAPPPRNEEEMMILIFQYIDRLLRIVRPRRLLYMAIDGVAPRAKMNQQRSRRFRASKETADKEEEIRKAKQKLLDEGLELPDPPQHKADRFDSNVITPGTEFMANLADNLRYYIHERLTSDPAWAHISVVLSDASVPGEGEHKIMDFIRKQRSNPDHDPNTHHCLCGADADLIMLGLATHEVNFTIIREEFKPNAPRPCELCGQPGHEMSGCRGKSQQQPDEDDFAPPPQPTAGVEFIFLRLPVLREYLAKELQPDRPLSYPFDLERAIDDWVFMCFFVGNDFLPHLPSLEIREGAIDRLIDLYKRNADRSGGYLTENGFVHLQRAQTILTELGKMEDGILKNRMFRAKSDRRRDKERERQKRKRDEEFGGSPPAKRRSGSDLHRAPAYHLGGAFAAVAVGRNMPDEYVNTPMAVSRQAVHEARVQASQYNDANQSSAQRLRAMLIAPGSAEARVVTTTQSNGHYGRSNSQQHHDDYSRSNSQQQDDNDEDPNDMVRLGEEGWKERYYMNKFGVSTAQDVRFQKELVRAYVEGLCWVLRYYYQGCPSWTWYYPYHYSPFASDFVDIGHLDIKFPVDTQPFKPLEQLMGVFPAASGTFLPEQWRRLMSDTDSPILDFYPTDFCVDLNGKKFAWQGVALLPFVDEDRLLKALANVYDSLSPLEVARNTRGHNLLFVAHKHKSFAALSEKYYGEVTLSVELDYQPVNARLIYGMAGLASLDSRAFRPNLLVHAPFPSLPAIQINRALSVLFRDPEYALDHMYPATRLSGAKEPMKVLGEGRAVTGFDPNRPRMSLDGAGHRMLNGAMGGGRGRGGYDSGSRGYNEDRYDSRREEHGRAYQGGYQGNGRGEYGQQQQQRHSYSGGYSGPPVNSSSYESGGGGGYRGPPRYQPYGSSSSSSSSSSRNDQLPYYDNRRGGGGGGYDSGRSSYDSGSRGGYQGGGYEQHESRYDSRRRGGYEQYDAPRRGGYEQYDSSARRGGYQGQQQQQTQPANRGGPAHYYTADYRPN